MITQITIRTDPCTGQNVNESPNARAWAYLGTLNQSLGMNKNGTTNFCRYTHLRPSLYCQYQIICVEYTSLVRADGTFQNFYHVRAKYPIRKWCCAAFRAVYKVFYLRDQRLNVAQVWGNHIADAIG